MFLMVKNCRRFGFAAGSHGHGFEMGKWRALSVGVHRPVGVGEFIGLFADQADD